jgi:hypothetical protein
VSALAARAADARPLTKRQRQVLVELLVGWWFGNVPTYREIVERVGISCTSHVAHVVAVLQLRGLVDVAGGKSRHLRVTAEGVREGLRLATEDELTRMLAEVGDRFTALRAEVALRSKRPIATNEDAIARVVQQLDRRSPGVRARVEPCGVAIVVTVEAASAPRFDEAFRAVPAFVCGIPTRVVLEEGGAA